MPEIPTDYDDSSQPGFRPDQSARVAGPVDGFHSYDTGLSSMTPEDAVRMQQALERGEDASVSLGRVVLPFASEITDRHPWGDRP